ncbi:MAG: IMPACT family protein, partial [Kaistella sp.]
MEFSFNTIKSAVENILLKEKGSKFIGFVFPLDDEKDLKKNLERIREEHPKATHHCYAFRLGIKGENYRANDDGEPSGSAGLPIYNQLLAHDITNVLLIVVRYYGGTKLGVSGLVKAYKESAKITLEDAEIITKELESEIEIAFSFNQQNQIFTLLNKF